jgi:hypothetical protein
MPPAGADPAPSSEAMSSNAPRPEEEKGRVLPFQPRDRLSRLRQPPAQTPIENLEKYARDHEPDDYRQRMINNGLGFGFCVVLVLVGVWLANSIADMRRNQDCVLSGRRNCANVAVPPANPT